LQVKCHVRKPRDTPIWKLEEAALDF